VSLTQGILGQKQINAFKAMFYFGLRPTELTKTRLEGKHFSAVTNLAYGTDVMSKIVAILKCNIGNKRLSPHSCRKGFQNWCSDKGETSIQAVSSWMGHLDVAMSFKVYRDRDRGLVGQAPIEKAS
jgi:integrase